MAPIAAEARRDHGDDTQADGGRAAPDARAQREGGPQRGGGLAEREAAFMRMYDEHADSIYAFFAFRVANRADAEDLTQIVFERALDSWHRFDHARTKPITWLTAIARNLLIDRHRRERARPVTLVGDAAVLDAAAGHQEAPQETALGLDPALESALARLSDRERELIALRFGVGMQGAQIADLTGLTLANVQQIMSRSIRRLREELGDLA